MKVVELTSNEIAIPITVKAYLTEYHLTRILADLLFYDEIKLPISKKEAIYQCKMHIRLKGYSCYPDWYEDTDDTHFWNECVEKATKYVKLKFPELNHLQLQ